MLKHYFYVNFNFSYYVILFYVFIYFLVIYFKFISSGTSMKPVIVLKISFIHK
jgi:hypothetical protein